jgi:hypothetical protein
MNKIELADVLEVEIPKKFGNAKMSTTKNYFSSQVVILMMKLQA